MIITGLVNLCLGVINGIMGVLPTYSTPSFITTMETDATHLGQQLAGFSTYLPLDALFNAVNFVLVAIGVLFAAKLSLKLLSLLTGGGGNG